MSRAHGGEEALHTRSVAVCLERQTDISWLHLSCSKRKQHKKPPEGCNKVLLIEAAVRAKGGSLHRSSLLQV